MRTLSWSEAIRIDNDPAGTVSAPQMAVDSDGNIMAIWLQSDDGPTYALANRVFASLFTVAGWQAPVLLNPDASGDMPVYAPRIVADGGGNFFAAWTQAWPVTDGTRLGVYGKRYLPGTGWEAAVTTIDADMADAGMSATGALDIAADSQGNATAVWAANDDSWAHMVVRAARYTPGTGWTPRQILTSEDVQSISGPSVAMDAAGNAMVVWGQATGASTSVQGVRAARYSVGNGWGAPVLIEPQAVAEAHSGIAPQVGFDARGDAIAVWYHQGQPGIYANRWSSASGWGSATAIAGASATSASEGARLAIDKQGHAIALWNQQGGGLLASRCADAGAWGPIEAVDPGGADDSGRIAIGQDGVAVAVWVRHAGTQNDIWANRSGLDMGWGSASLVNPIVDKTSTASDPQVVIDQTSTATVLWWQDKCLYAARAAVGGL
jgi:hypothetical protein